MGKIHIIKIAIQILIMKILFVWAGPINLKFRSKPQNRPFNDSLTKMSSIQNLLVFKILSALTPKEHSIDVVEVHHPSDIDYDKKYDIVGITCMTQYVLLAYELADEFRRRGVPVVLGGYHPSALPEEAKQHADSVVVGEAEITWLQLLEDLQNGKLKPFYWQERPFDLAKIPVIKSFSEQEMIGIQATRGCPYGCEFCSITHAKFGNIFRTRSVRDVIEEIISIKKDLFIFFDNSLTINPNYTKQLFREMKELNKKFIAYGNINVLGKDKEFLKLANEAGCVGWVIGFESISQKTIKNIGKTTNNVEEYASSVRKVHEYNMYVNGSFIFGFDTDTKDVFNTTLDAIKYIEIDNPLVFPLVPYPGSLVFEKFDSEGRILTKNWNRYNFEDVVFQPKNMTREELLQGIFNLDDELYSTSNTMRRIFNSFKLGFYPFRIIAFNSIAHWKVVNHNI